MKSKTFARAAAAALVLALTSGNAAARSEDTTPPDTVCTVLGTAARYVGTTVTIRGVASMDGHVATLSDAGCPGAVDLSMEGDVRKRDVTAFRRAVSEKGARADATVFGRFKATGDAQRPYAIDVYSVRNVNELVVAEGG